MSYRPFSAPDSRVLLGWIALAAVFASALALAAHGLYVTDEGVHWEQVRIFLEEEWDFHTKLTTFPGWHLFAALVLSPLDTATLHHLRILTACSAIPAVLAIWNIRRRLGTGDAQRSSAQLLLLPVLFPWWFLAYTDAPAVALLLLALSASVAGRHGLAALGLFGALLVRQHFVAWGVLLALPVLTAPAGAGRTHRHWCQLIGYALAGTAFCAWWVWNGSVSLSVEEASEMHPDFRFGAENPLVLLAAAAMLMPLHVGAGLVRFWAMLRRNPAWLLLPAATIAASAFLFSVQHPYNHIAPQYFLRNAVLLQVEAEPWLRAGFGTMAATSACGFAATRFVRPYDRVLLPLSLLFVSASWLIELRYSIVPIALWLALRIPESPWIERSTLVWWLFCCGLLLPGMLQHEFMP